MERLGNYSVWGERERAPTLLMSMAIVYVRTLLVSLISRLVACRARIVVDKHTNKHTDTDTQNDYLPSLRMRAEGKTLIARLDRKSRRAQGQTTLKDIVHLRSLEVT